MGDAIKYIYSQFILRDVLSFITPGAIVIIAAVLLFLPEIYLTQRLETLFEYSTSFHWLLYVPFFGLCYAIGYAIQCFLVLSYFVGLHKTDKDNCKERWSLLRCGWQSYDDYLKCTRVRGIKFLNATYRANWAIQHHERSVVLKQMSANIFGAIVISSIFIGISYCSCDIVHLVVFSIISFILVFSLFWGYRSSESAVDTIEQEVIKLSDNRNLNEDK